jgi:hypothetical protein
LERRKHSRLNLHERVALRLIALPEEGRNGAGEAEIPGKIEDLSRGGAAIEVGAFLPPGALVEIRTEVFTVLAEVRRCQLHEDGAYRVAAEFGQAIRGADVTTLAAPAASWRLA